MSAPNVLLASKGHPFQREPFFQMFDAFQQEGEISAWTHVEQPAAQLFFQPENSRDYDCIVDYSMPGVFGVGGPPDPPEALKDGYMRLTEEGKGLVMIHHNICSWPGWEEYAEIIGGRFFYNPGSLRGVDYPDSGYLLAANHTCEVVAEEADHPVVQGVDLSFELQDEIYLAPYHEDSLVPLVRSDFDFTYKNFFSPSLVVNDGRMYERGDWTTRRPRTWWSGRRTTATAPSSTCRRATCPPPTTIRTTVGCSPTPSSGSPPTRPTSGHARATPPRSPKGGKRNHGQQLCA